MATTTFVLKEPKSKDETLVYLLFCYHNKRLKYSTGQKINPKFWNPQSQKARETKEFRGHTEFNTHLKRLEDNVSNIYRKLVNDNITPTPDKIRFELKNLSVEKELKKSNNLIQFANELIETSSKKPNTIKGYKQTLRLLNEFKPYFKREMTFENIDLDFYESFLNYCNKENYGANTVGGYIKNIKVFMNEAFDRKLTQNIEFKNRRFKTLEEDSDSIYLTQEEINTLYNLDLSDNKKLDSVRDMFIIGCYTGLRYSDLIKINDKNLIEDGTKLKIKTQKTGEVIVIPLHKHIRKILKKHGGFPDYAISNQKMNVYLKELGEKAGLTEKILISTIKGGVKQSESFKKYELITVHTARRSFATNAYLMDVPSISIMKITGHRTEKSFLQYIKMSQEENANKLTKHPFFK